MKFPQELKLLAIDVFIECYPQTDKTPLVNAALLEACPGAYSYQQDFDELPPKSVLIETYWQQLSPEIQAAITEIAELERRSRNDRD